jgi:hypothetical protein
METLANWVMSVRPGGCRAQYHADHLDRMPIWPLAAANLGLAFQSPNDSAAECEREAGSPQAVQNKW